MGETADAIKDDIEHRRRAMTHDVNELEERAKSMTDWRQHVEDRPMTVLGLAAAGGLLIGWLTGSSSDRAREPRYGSSYQPQSQNGGGHGVSGWVTGEHGPTQATQAGKDRAASKVDEIRGALMGLAASKAEEFLKEALPGFSQEVDRVQQKRDGGGRESSGRASDRPNSVSAT